MAKSFEKSATFANFPRFVSTLALSFTLFAAAAQAQDGRSDITSRLYLGAALADVATTGLAAARQPGFYESNPMFGWVMDRHQVAAGQRASAGQVAAVLAMSAAFDVATVWAINRYVEPHHPKLAKAFFLIGIGVRGTQAAVNVQVGRGKTHGL